MSGSAPPRRHLSLPIWIAPLLVWAVLVALLLISLGAAFLPLGPAKTSISLGIAGLKAGLIAFVYMRLDLASGLVRLAALAGLIWVIFMFALTCADFMTRP